jgi:hypothetical protein
LEANSARKSCQEVGPSDFAIEVDYLQICQIMGLEQWELLQHSGAEQSIGRTVDGCHAGHPSVRMLPQHILCTPHHSQQHGVLLLFPVGLSNQADGLVIPAVA